MKKIIFTVLLSSFISSVFSQDMIVKKSGEDIKSKVLEVGLDNIKYKKFDNKSGPIFTIPKKDVLMIRYENGTKDMFNKKAEPQLTKDTTLPNEKSTETKKSKVYISFLLGASVPIGDFGEKGVNSQGGGFAKTGSLFDFSLAFKLNKYFALSGAVRGQLNSVDAQALVSNIANQNPNINWTVQTKSWGIANLMLGLITSLPMSEKANFDIKTMIGYSNSFSPETALTGRNTNGVSSATQASGTASSLSYLIGAGFRFEISNSLYFLTNVDYYGATPNFTDVKTTTSTGNNSTSNFKQNIRSVNFTVGLGIKL